MEVVVEASCDYLLIAVARESMANAWHFTTFLVNRFAEGIHDPEESPMCPVRVVVPRGSYGHERNWIVCGVMNLRKEGRDVVVDEISPVIVPLTPILVCELTIWVEELFARKRGLADLEIEVVNDGLWVNPMIGHYKINDLDNSTIIRISGKGNVRVK